jgi:hypothetical protein
VTSVGVRPEYFRDGRVSPDDDVHFAAIEEGIIPEACRLGGPSISLLRPVADARAVKLCDLCPYTHRNICGGAPKPTADLYKSTEDPKFRLDVDELALRLRTSEAASLKMKRDAARAKLENGVRTAASERRKGRHKP